MKTGNIMTYTTSKQTRSNNMISNNKFVRFVRFVVNSSLLPLFLFSFFIFLSSFAFAQNATDIDAILSTETISCEQAAWLVLGAADAPGFSGGAAEAFRYAMERGWLPAKAAPNGNARLDEISLLIMQSHHINGGFMYTLTKIPRYAYRELVHLNIIQGRADPQMAVSGDLLLFILTRVLYYQEDEL